MGNIFIAINGDDVGSRIGQAIANDDHDGLTQATSAIQNAHDSIDQWINSVGGKKISSAGDDAIYMVPDQAVNDLDEIREQYKQESGHGLTVGVGASMSQASKALIYGKMNGKNQTIHYEPNIEDYLSDDEEQNPEVPAEDELQDQADTDLEADAGAGALEGAPPQEDVDDSESAVPGAEAPEMDEDQEDPQASMEDDSEIPPAGDEDDMASDDQTATDAPAEPAANQTPAQQANKTPQANTPPIDGKTDKDFGTSEDDMAEDQDAPADISGDEDMPDSDEGAADDTGGPIAEDPASEASNDDMDGSSVHDPAAQGDHDELSDDDVAAPQEDDGEDPLASMIHEDMQNDGDDQEGMEDTEGDESLDDELRNDIATALMSFKENKHMLEQARDQNPELYNATLTMLRSMIAMAKKLGFAPEQDMADQEANAGLQEGFPEAGDEDAEMPAEDTSEEETDEESAEPSDDENAPPEKK